MFLNSLFRFQQIVGVHTFQAYSEQIKVIHHGLHNSIFHILKVDLVTQAPGGSGPVEEHSQSNCF